jgi:acyl-CoA reductase-like NAD-dependent aldehyde dehydrogenase
MCLSSRKDFRNAVVAARASFTPWSSRAAFNRSQIIYRIAEMLETRKAQFVEELMIQGVTKKNAELEVSQSIDAIVYFAGWADKFQAVFSSVNPVASSHFNFSVPEATGVVSVIAPQQSGLLGLVNAIIPCITGGNTCVVLASESMPLCSVTFSEVLATSDLPAGVVNIFTGSNQELVSHMSNHMDVNAVVYYGDNQEHLKLIQENASLNVKRVFHYNDYKQEEPYKIMDLQEIKTTWHPIENIGTSGAKY